MRSLQDTVPLGTLALSLAAVVQVLYAVQPVAFLNEHVLTVDDTYYYLEIARNLAWKGWATFDGLHRTSGVQLLWTAILVALARVVYDPLHFLRAMLLLCVGLNVAAGLMLRRLGRGVHSAPVGEIAALLWAVVMISSGTTLSGMEYSLHFAVILACLLALQRALSAPDGRGLVAVSVLATVNYWTRLDSAVFSLLMLTGVSLRLAILRPAGWRRSTAVVWVIPAAGAVAYVATCYALAGTPLPISGQVKAFYAGEHFAGHPWWLAAAGQASWWLRVQVQPVSTLLPSALGRAPWSALLPLRAAAAAGVLVLMAWILVRARTWAPDRRLAGFTLGLWLVSVVHVGLVVATVGHFSHVTTHYYGWLLVSWIFMLALLVDLGLRTRAAAQRRVVAGVAAALVAVLQGVAVTGALGAPADPTHLRNVRTELIAWIDTHLPAGAPIAAWNAGQLGYFLERPVVNVDGLVNDAGFLDSLRHHEPVARYLRRTGVEYIVDYNNNDLSMPYRATWDPARMFRGVIPMTEVEPLLTRTSGDLTLHVLRLKPEPTAPSHR